MKYQGTVNAVKEGLNSPVLQSAERNCINNKKLTLVRITSNSKKTILLSKRMELCVFSDRSCSSLAIIDNLEVGIKTKRLIQLKSIRDKGRRLMIPFLYIKSI